MLHLCRAEKEVTLAPSDIPASVPQGLAARLAGSGAELGAAGQRVLRFIAQNPAVALASSATVLASRTNTSDATVIRTAQALGYAGLAELKLALAASLDRSEPPATPAEGMRVTLEELHGASLRAVETVLDAHSEVLRTLRSAACGEQLGRLVPLLQAAKRIVLFGIGPSSALARYAALALTRTGRRTLCLDASGIMLADQLLDLREGDAVLAMAYGRPYREVLGLLSHARSLSLPFVLLTDRSGNALAKAADVAFIIPRGRSQHVALHAGTMLALEIVVLALAACDPERSLAQLERLNELRVAIGDRHDQPHPAPGA